MNEKKAVEEALAGKESGFSWLYESTQRDMYYIALKYMKNEEDAMDVVQDSYLKAWRSLASLKDPASFPAWLGRIVANTAKNALAKKRPVLFSQIEGENDQGEIWEFDIEDDKTEFQPEYSYTRKETQELVHELIDSLSDEQRLCILMYHLDNQSIKDIAQTFGVSENTVKSRLLYGRKAIKAKAEELQKKGYQLYSAAPMVLLVSLLRSEKASAAFGAAASGAMQAQKAGILEGTKLSGKIGRKAVKQAFFHTAAGKAAAAAVAVAVIGGGGAAAYHYMGSDTGEKPLTAAEAGQTETALDSEITIAPQEAEPPQPTAAPTAAPTAVPTVAPETEDQDPAAAYTPVIQAAAAGDTEYTFPEYADGSYGQPTGELEYALYDMDQDGNKELILKEGLAQGPFIYSAFRVYTAENTGAGYEAKAIEGSEISLNLSIPLEGPGLLSLGDLSRGMGYEDFFRVTIQDGVLTTGEEAELQVIMGSDSHVVNVEQAPELHWFPVSDPGGLN